MRSHLIVIPLALLLGTVAISDRSHTTRSASAASPRTRLIDSALTLKAGSTQSLFVIRGFHYGTVGRFVAACSRSGTAQTTYVVDGRGPDALVAVDGRGAARGAKLAARNRSLSGGSRPSGIERWIVRAGGQPEEIELDASLLVISAKDGLGHCHLSLRGTLVITRH